MQRLKFVLSTTAVGLALASFPIVCAAQMPSQGSPNNMSASAGNGSSLSTSDKKFVNEAAQGGMAEVELGRLATERGSNDAVKKFGQRMVDDHTKANDQLKQIAGSKGVDLPQDVSPKDKATMNRLSKLNGAQFDQAYMSDMVKDHKKDVAAFQRESSSGADPDIKNFATQTLPTLRSHLSEAENVAPNIAMGGQSMSNPATQPSSR
jgi:putative membrane protein